MKKLFLLLSLFPLWRPGGLYAANCVSVHSVSANYATKTVIFTLTWSGCNGADHLNKAWVFVDYQAITGSTRGTWAPATIVGTPSVSNGTYAAGNSRGFYITGVNGQTATVTVTLTNVPAQFNWCAYATDYPPNVTVSGGTYTLHGTAPFTLIAADGTNTQTVTGNTIVASALTVAPVTIKDATGCPGVFCIYRGIDLHIDATHLCRTRDTGAKNWEAWIKDTRDNELYRIVLMPDNNWWTAEEIRYDASATKQSFKCPNGGKTIYNRPVVACPNGWVLPSLAEWTTLRSLGTCADFSAVTSRCPGTDSYGYSHVSNTNHSNNSNSDYPTTCSDQNSEYRSPTHTSDGYRVHPFCTRPTATCPSGFENTNTLSWNQARCIRNK